MALAFVQQNQALSNTSVTTLGVTFTGNTTTGNCIVVAIGNVLGAGAATNVTDSQSNIYQRALTAKNSTIAQLDIWYALNITGGTTPTVTATFPSIEVTVQIAEFSGVAHSFAIDKAIGTALASIISPLTVTPNYDNYYPNTLVVMMATMNDSADTYSLGSGYSNLQQEVASITGNAAMQSKVVSSIGSQAGSFTYSAVTTKSGVVAMIMLADTPIPTYGINNYQFVKSQDNGNGVMSVSEKIR